MYRQRTKLAHRVTSASSPGVTGTPPPPQGNNRWPEARSTPPPPGPQFFNPNTLGPSPAASPGPPQQQQQSWQQPQQFNTPPPVQQQQWYNQPASKPATPLSHIPLPPSTNNNNSTLNDSWNWGVQDQWGEVDTQQQQQHPQWQQQQRQQVPQPQQQFQQQQVPPQQYPNMQQQQGYQQQQNDAWNWNWNQGNQDAAWNWSLEDSSPSTESSNGPQQQVPNQYQQNYQQQQQDSYQYYNNTQPQQQQQYPPESVETQHEVPKENNVDSKQENGSEVHSVSCSELDFSDQVDVAKQTNLESDYRESEQGRESSFSENTAYSEQARGSVAYSEPGRESVAYSEQGRESSLSQNVSFSEQARGSVPYSEQARGSITYSEQGRESSLSYSEQGRESVAYSEQPRGSVAYSEQGRESSMSQSVAYSEQGLESSLSQNAAYSEQPRGSITYSEQGRESSLSQNAAYSEQPRSSITYSEQGRESALAVYSEQARGSVTEQRQPELEARPDLIEDQSLLEEINTQQPPDLVTDFENREIVPPESFPRYQQKQPVVPTSATLVAAAIGANLETVPDNIERPEDAVPLQPVTPPPPPPPTNQGRLGVGQDDPSPWPNTIPPPENQEVATNLPPPPPMGRPSRHHATPPLPPPPSVDPVSASDRNQFLETGQLSADIPLFSRRQTIPGESRQSPEPGLRVVPGTTEPDEPLPGSQRSETIGSDFDDVRVGRRTNAEGFNIEPTQIGSEQRPNVEGLQTRPPNTRSSSESLRMDETRPNVEGNQTRPPVRPLPEPVRTVTVGNEVHETRPNVEGNQTRPPVRPTPEPVRTVTVGNEVHETRPNVEGNQTRPPVRPTPEPVRTVTVGNEVHETRPNVEGNQTRPPVRPQVPEPIRSVTETRPYTEGNQTRPPMGPTNLRTNAEGTNVRTQPARSVLGGTEVPRTNAEGTNDDVRRVRGTNSTQATPPPRIGSQERSSAFTEVRSTPTQNRPPPETARSSGEGDNPSGSELEEGEISDLDNISSGDMDMDKDLDISTEDRSKDEGRKKSPQLARDPEEHRPPSNDSAARRNDQTDRRGGSRDRDRRSADRDRARGKPPRPQEEPKRRDRETPPRGRHRRNYDDEDSDSYHSERGERGEDRRRRYKDDPKRRSPDRRHRSSRHGRHDYYQDDYRYHGEYRRDYDERYHRGSRPSSRAGSEARRGPDYESDHQSQKSHREDRERERGHRKPPPGPSYYDKYGRYVRPDPRDPYYRDPYNYYGHYNYASPHQAAPQATVPPMQHPEYNQYSYAYFEELRRSNPLAYAEWYRRFIATQQGPGSSVNLEPYVDEDRNSRGSVHSGQSSINEEIRYQARLQHGRSPAHSLRDYSCSPYHPPSSSGLPPAAPHTPASLPPVYPQQYTYQAYQPSQAGSAANRIASPTPAPRLTPAKFSSSHASGGLCVQGRLVHILPHLPRDGQMATVFIHDIGALLANDPVTEELRSFPGPLVRGTTHKNSVIQFCTLKIRAAEMDPLIFDRDSYILVWKLLILLLRQNGTVVGADIAELLLEDVDQEEERSRSPSPSRDDTGHQSTQHQLTHKFRQYLLYGNTKEALDWAMKHGLWGHALFLASKMDNRTYANVMTRFANGLPLNDPLQTLYQLMSGRQPAAVTSCADEKWGDWRPHLAMILSNPTQRPELDHRAITTLGDTLASRGCLHASHFCYLLAQLEFGTHCQQPPAKLVLLGSSHTSLPLEAFASCEAIQSTEVYEYACRLANPSFYLPHFQTYKFMYACRLVEHGFPMEGLQYCEEIAGALTSMSHAANTALAEQVATLADALKFSDPTLEPLQGGDSFYANDPVWLQQLRTLVDHTEALTEGMADLQLSHQSMEYSPQQQHQQEEQHQDPQQSESLTAEWQEYYRQKEQWDAQQAAIQQQVVDTSQQQQQSIDAGSAGPESIQAEPQPQQQQQQMPPQSDYWPSSQQPIFTPSTPEPVQNGTDQDTTGHSDYWSNAARNSFSQDQSESQERTCDSVSTYKALVPMSQYNDPRSIPFHVRPRKDPFEPFLARLLPVPSKRTIYLGDKPLVFGGTYPIDKPIASRFMPTKTFNIDEPADFARAKPVQPPTITMAGQRRQKTFSESSTGSNHKAPASSSSPKRPAKPATSPGQQQNSGWFGGIFSKMSWKPKNQMKLPDDKNPTIVWDEARGRWVNTEGGDNDSIAELKPPPKALGMNTSAPMSQVPTSTPSSQQQQQQQTNGSAQPPPPVAGAGYKLGKGMRKNYVNVLQQNGTAPQQGSKPAPTDIFPNLSQSSAPVNFFIPQPVSNTDGSGEPVTQFTTPASSVPNSPPESDQDHSQQQFPMMYNPTQFTGTQNNFAY